jgi:hypothetical protein
MMIITDLEDVPGLTILLRLDCLAATTVDARRKLQALHDVAIVKEEAIKSVLFEPIDLETLVESIGDILELSGHRDTVDNVWMAAPIRSVLPGIHRIVRHLAPAPLHLYLLYWVGTKPTITCPTWLSRWRQSCTSAIFPSIAILPKTRPTITWSALVWAR